MRVETTDGRIVAVTSDGDYLVLSEKAKKRGQPPKQTRVDIHKLLAGDVSSVVDDLVRRLPIADLSDIRPDKLGYELKARLLKLCR